ncbi:MAG: hypothetical protein JW932_06180 [Deltaproteobacteria bacterium]|nr:hypothetical protein [Deltaproteobacteria bacterium]
MSEYSISHMDSDNACRKNREELIRTLRYSVALQYEAMQRFLQLAGYIENQKAKRLLVDAADDEKEKAEKILRLLEGFSRNEPGHQENWVSRAEGMFNMPSIPFDKGRSYDDLKDCEFSR